MQRAYGFAIDTDTGAIAASPTVTVYNAGTLTLSTIYSDDGVTPLGNPFTGASSGYWFFYAANGYYDVKITKSGNPDYTLGDIGLNDNFTLNGQTGASQTFATGTAGTDFAISSAANVHTFNIPDASATARGVVTTGTQTIAGAKTFSGGVTLGTPLPIASGGLATSSTPTNGQVPIGNGTNYTLAALTGTANRVSVTNGAGSITLSAPQDLHTAATPTFAGLTVTNLVGNRVMTSGTGGLVQETSLTDGQILIGSTGAAPVAATITAGSGISVANGAGTIEISTSAAGMTTLNTLTAAVQTFATGTAGSDFNISSSVSAHTFNVPDAGSGNRGFVGTGNQDLGGGIKHFADPPTFYPGTQSTNKATVGGWLYTDVSTHAMTGTTETDLSTYTLKGNTLSANGKVVRVTAGGSVTNTGGTKTLAFYFGASSVTVHSSNGWDNNMWHVVVDIIRTGAATQYVFGLFAYNATSAGSGRSIGSLSFTATCANDNIIKFTGDGSGASDGVTQNYMMVEVIG